MAGRLLCLIWLIVVSGAPGLASAADPVIIYADIQDGYLLIPAPATGFPISESPHLIAADPIPSETVIVEVWQVIRGTAERRRLTQKLLDADGRLEIELQPDQVIELRPFRILGDGSKELLVKDWIFFTYDS